MKMLGDATSVRVRPRYSALIAAVAAAVLCSSARVALGFDRPDLLDVGERFGVLEDNNAFIFASQVDGDTQMIVYGYFTAFTNEALNNYVYLRWQLYEPDKITRKSDGAKLKQKDLVAIRAGFFTTATSNTVSAVLVPGCKANVSTKGVKAKWKVKCGSNILDSLGLNATQKNAFTKAFGTSDITEISGQAP